MVKESYQLPQKQNVDVNLDKDVELCLLNHNYCVHQPHQNRCLLVTATPKGFLLWVGKLAIFNRIQYWWYSEMPKIIWPKI